MKNRIAILLLGGLCAFLSCAEASPHKVILIDDTPSYELADLNIPLIFCPVDIDHERVEQVFLRPSQRVLELRGYKKVETTRIVPRKTGKVYGKQGSGYFKLARNSLNRQAFLPLD
jgi:hypothetical protein